MKKNLEKLFIYSSSLINSWPFLMFFSQKTLVASGIFLLLRNRLVNSRDFFVCILMLLSALLLFIFNHDNEYGMVHFLGYITFLLFIPLINAGVILNKSLVIKVLSFLTFLNASLAIYIYFFSIDISELRGLNRIIGNDGVVNRIFYESASLIAVFSVSWWRGRALKFLAIVLVAFYALFLAKSIFVIILYLANIGFERLSGSSKKMKFIYLFIAAIILICLYISVFTFRPDVGLSLSLKIKQFQEILEDDSSFLFGGGWGYYIPSIVNSLDQPYQIEMQLPMLFRQIGLFGLITYVVGICFFIKTVSENWSFAIFRTVVYLIIGMNNPWLLLPSWYLTSILMFQNNRLAKK